MGVDTARKSQEEINALAIEAIKTLSKDVGIPAGLAEIGVKEADFGELADLALADICTGGNPKCPTKEDVIAIYKAAF